MTEDPINYGDFVHELPYASQLFGVYQALPGWHGAQSTNRVQQEQVRVTRSIVTAMSVDPRLRSQLNGQFQLARPTQYLRARLPSWLSSPLAADIQERASALVASRSSPPQASEWQQIVRDGVSQLEKKYAQESSVQVRQVPGINAEFIDAQSLSTQQLDTLRAQLIPGTKLAVRAAAPSARESRDSVIAGVLAYMADEAPSVLNALFVAPKPAWARMVPFSDPISAYTTPGQDELTVLSPIGVLHLFRQYFFDFGAFLGPPVAHVWVSAGGSLELFEVKRRRTTSERLFEKVTETLSRSEVETVDRDEISDAMRTENESNTTMGISVSAGGGIGVWHADASYNYQEAQTARSAQETTHKHMHQQTERLTNEIRRSFKTSFRTTIEAEDETTRRHVIQNPTDKLLNYELRRKIRKVGVQVRHIGTELCWQVFVRDPGTELGVSELVHIARPDDLEGSLQPPDSPQGLPNKDAQFKFVFQLQPVTDDYDNQADYNRGEEEDGSRIRWQETKTAPPPAPGYELFDVEENSAARGNDPGNEAPVVTWDKNIDDPSAGTFTISFTKVNFKENNSLTLDLRLIWRPGPAATEAATANYSERLAEYTEERRRLTHRAYVDAARERVKLASNIVPRDSLALRTEEHGSIMGRLAAQLMGGAGNERGTVAAEQISALFDLERMLYFVAPDWWVPRRHYRQQLSGSALPLAQYVPPAGPGSLADAIADAIRQRQQFGAGISPGQGSAGQAADGGTSGDTAIGAPGAPAAGPAAGRPSTADGSTETLTNRDLVGWGGIEETARDNYLITEDSNPAPLGASLGWLIQLDGDDRRNAFLNSPWVKAVLPIRLGKEVDAIAWLVKSHVEDIDGLGLSYTNPEPISLPDGSTVTPANIGEAVQAVARALQQQNVAPVDRERAGELVFEQGFNPIDENKRLAGEPFTAFDQFAFTVDTDQVVAVQFET